MRAIIGVPVGLVIYVIAVVAIMTFCLWFFDKPQEWRIAIPIITSLFSSSIACSIAEGISKISEKIVAALIALFWIAFVVVDVTGSIQNWISVIQGKTPTMDEIDMVMFYVDGVLNAKIFAVVSGLIAFGNFSK